MRIDPATHTMIPLLHVSRHVPGNPHVATIHRWAIHGVRGRKLATVMIGARRWTSLEALREFISSDQPEPGPVESDDDRLRRARQAGRALEKLGA